MIGKSVDQAFLQFYDSNRHLLHLHLLTLHAIRIIRHLRFQVTEMTPSIFFVHLASFDFPISFDFTGRIWDITTALSTEIRLKEANLKALRSKSSEASKSLPRNISNDFIQKEIAKITTCGSQRDPSLKESRERSEIALASLLLLDHSQSSTEPPLDHPEARRSIGPPPEARHSSGPPPEARRSSVPPPEARSSARPPPEARRSVGPPPEARRSTGPPLEARRSAGPPPEARRSPGPPPEAQHLLDHRLRPDVLPDHRLRPDTTVGPPLDARVLPDHHIRPDILLDHHLRPDILLDHHLRPDVLPNNHQRPNVLSDNHLKPNK
ncbi:hypothetical protein M5K25_024858 [Dendrobium thyrsiflorum]|uniref:Uncharacterized protein n=1 Tax=Dendrobium thyrsiflorum TaxID=117978 RepID=A0ABD0U2Z8_DENTH